MKKFLFIVTVTASLLFLSGCPDTYLQRAALDSANREQALMPITITVMEYIDDGSQKMKECKNACDSQKMQCVQLAILERDHSNFSDSYGIQKRLDERICNAKNDNCFKDVCGGKIEPRTHTTTSKQIDSIL